MARIIITAGELKLPAELYETPTAQRIWAVLPISGRANTWGHEIYFEIPVWAAEEEDARAEVTVGELGYWPLGHAFCVFFGPTPASTDEHPRAYSPVNIVGRILGNATALRAVRDGEAVTVAPET